MLAALRVRRIRLLLSMNNIHVVHLLRRLVWRPFKNAPGVFVLQPFDVRLHGCRR